MAAEDYGRCAEVRDEALTHLRAIIEGPEGTEGIDAGREFLRWLDEEN